MRRLSEVMLIGCVGLVLGLAMPAGATHEGCPHDSVRVGTICLDKYEASVWLIPPPLSVVERNVIMKIRAGTVTLTDLKQAGAKQLGLDVDDLADNGCPPDGFGCVDVYAVSIAGVMPAGSITWFQAAAAARNSFKRLPTNAEWQAGALGAGFGCNVGSDEVERTGSRASCVSDSGAFDMVGNVAEFVQEWVRVGYIGDVYCIDWGTFSNGAVCFPAPGPVVPGPLLRGGSHLEKSGRGAGALTLYGPMELTQSFSNFGFRAAREAR